MLHETPKFFSFGIRTEVLGTYALRTVPTILLITFNKANLHLGA